jgi:hypothetical protein
MTIELLQDALVTLAALAAGAVVLRRVMGVAAADAPPRCANCQDAKSACAAGPADQAPADPPARPLIVIRSQRR